MGAPATEEQQHNEREQGQGGEGSDKVVMVVDGTTTEASAAASSSGSDSCKKQQKPKAAKPAKPQAEAEGDADDEPGVPRNRITHGTTKLWHIPPELKGSGKPVKLGIDEAGRGPVMGPMVYACAFWAVEEDEAMCAMGFNDSKQLDEKAREGLFKRMLRTPRLGWVIHSLTAAEISGGMLRREPYSLNALSHDTAADLISLVLAEGVTVTEVFVDTVGDPEMYQRKLQALFAHHTPAIQVTVAKKADSIYKTVSAASIAAKVTRDRVVSTWTWEETFPTGPLPIDFGSGYPSDQRASDWLAKHSDPLFGFPSLIRFSWSTAREHMERHCAPVAWQHEEDEDEGALPPGTASIEAFIKKRPTPAGAAAANAPGAGSNVGGNGKKARKRAKYFSQRNVEVVGSF